MPTVTRVRRKRGPALAWTPTQDSYYELVQRLRSQERLPLHVTQAAILEFEAHLRESSLPLPFGLLAGDVCVCPQTKLEYLLVDTVARAHVELGGDDPYVQLAEELQSLASKESGKRKVAIGWYLGGLADDLTLDDDVTRLHQQLFPERWQLALVRGAASGAELGAFVRYESIWRRWYQIPFFEFVSEGVGPERNERRTAIRWENYRAAEPARPLDESEVSARGVNGASRRSWRTRFFGASPSPLPAPEPSPAQPAERKIAVAEPRIAPTRQLKVASTEELHVAAPADVKPVLPSAPSVTSPVETRAAGAEPTPEVQHVFIDGILVPAPLAPALSTKPGISPRSDRVSVSSVLAGALLLMMLVLLYIVAR